MTFKTDDRVFENSETTGTGTYTLDGAQVGFTTFAGMGNNNDCPYFATDDTNWEVGIGTVLTGPNRLVRTAVLRSSNADAAVNWGAGTRKIRCGWPAAMALPRVLSKSVAGNADVALTTDEQRRAVIILTGALTGNINVTVDASPWSWPMVFNNTTGAYTLTFKTTAGTGVEIPQNVRLPLVCDGLNVAPASNAGIMLSAQASGAGIGNGADATDDTLFTYTLPANLLYAVGKTLFVRAFGGGAANGNVKTVQLFFGAVASGNFSFSNAGPSWVLDSVITFLSATKLSWITFLYVTDGTNTKIISDGGRQNVTVPDVTANPSIIKLTGKSGASVANDVLGYNLTVALFG